MGIGILHVKDSRDPLAVPGTCLLDPPVDPADVDSSNLKRDKKRSELILRPQPSDNVADPLNW